MNMLTACLIFGPFIGGIAANAVISRLTDDAPADARDAKRPSGAYRKAFDKADANAADREALRASDLGVPAPGTLPRTAAAHGFADDEMPDGFYAGAAEPLDLSEFTARSVS